MRRKALKYILRGKMVLSRAANWTPLVYNTDPVKNYVERN
jgi:hypothetical protein